jgi:hypothetical protein
MVRAPRIASVATIVHERVRDERLVVKVMRLDPFLAAVATNRLLQEKPSATETTNDATRGRRGRSRVAS